MSVTTTDVIQNPGFFVTANDTIRLIDGSVVSVNATASLNMGKDYRRQDKHHTIYTVASCIDEDLETVFAIKLPEGWSKIDL